MRCNSVITRARLPYDNDIPLTNLLRWCSGRQVSSYRRETRAASLVSTCELARINEVSRAESEGIGLQSHPAAHRLLFQRSDEKQSGRKSSLAHLCNSSHFRNGGSVLGGCPPLAGNISEIRVSFRPTNFRVGEK